MAISACSFYIKNSCFFFALREKSKKNEEKRARADPFWQRKIRKARRWFCFLCGSSSALKKYVLQHVLFVLLDVQIGCQWMKQVVLGYENFQLYIQLSWTSCTCSGDCALGTLPTLWVMVSSGDPKKSPKRIAIVWYQVRLQMSWKFQRGCNHSNHSRTGVGSM